MILALIGLAILVQFNRFTVVLGAASLILVAAYPFMKRITWWPQAWLGLTFNWGALMGFAAQTGRLDLPDMLLYAGLFFWTLGYDTIYAHQDKEDDALIGVKSTARLLMSQSGTWILRFYAVCFTLVLAAGFAEHAGWPFGSGDAGGGRASSLAGAPPRYQRRRALPDAVSRQRHHRRAVRGKLLLLPPGSDEQRPISSATTPNSSPPPLVPEIKLHLASEVLPLWRKTEEELAEIGVPPPYWAFAWAGGQALARYVLDHPDLVAGKRVLDFGAGSGLVALAAAKAGAAHVIAADIDPFRRRRNRRAMPRPMRSPSKPWTRT